MDFIIDEAEVSDKIYSENSDHYTDNDGLLDDFIVPDQNCKNDSATFYRKCQNFNNQQKNAEQEIYKIEDLYFGEDGQPEMFAPETSDCVEFHDFSDYKKKAEQFRKTLLCFPPDTEPNCFFSSVVYALAYLQKNEKPSDFLAAKTAIRTENFLKLNQIKEEIMLDYTQFGFFDHCMKVNGLLASEFSYFLRFFERRNKFRYQLRQKLNGKNETKAELSSCVLQKFNGYNFLRNEIVYSEKKNLLPLDIVYEPTQHKTKSIYDKFQKGKKKFIKCSTAKQCRYCNNFFVKSEKKMQEHTSCCAGQSSFSYLFDNDRIINYQDNFNKIGDLPLPLTMILRQLLEAQFFLMQKCT